MAECTPGPTSTRRRGINGGTREGAEKPDAPGVALLLPEHPALAQPAQDHHRPGARRRVRRRPDADVGLRPDRRAPRTSSFADVVGTRLGMCGVEYFAHPWEFGPAQDQGAACSPATRSTSTRPTGSAWSARCSRATSSPTSTLEFARRIAQLPTMTALLIKESVNQTVDNMGFYNALQRLLHPAPAEPRALGRGPRGQVPDRRRGRTASPNWHDAPPIVPAVKDKVRAGG